MLRFSSLRRAVQRPFADWMALAEAWSSLAAIDLGLRLLPFRKVERLCAAPPRRSGDPGAAAADVARCVWAAGAASRHHLWALRCLPHALCLRRLLARRGIEGSLRIGVARDGSELLAHAWIEWDGRPLGETEESIARFAPLLGDEEADRAVSLLAR